MRAILALGLLLLSASPAYAEGPEQLYEPGPEHGEWSLEYNGQIGLSGEGERSHSLELFAGLSDAIAVGIEVEGDAADGRFRVGEVAVEALVMLTPRDAPIEAALLVQAGVTTDGVGPQLQTRLIVRHLSPRWDLLGNLIARRSEGEEAGSEVAYAAAVHRRFGNWVGIGMEASGSVARLGGFDDGYNRRHFIGPSLIVSLELPGERMLELGVKYLRRIAGSDENRDTLRIVAGFEF